MSAASVSVSYIKYGIVRRDDGNRSESFKTKEAVRLNDHEVNL